MWFGYAWWLWWVAFVIIFFCLPLGVRLGLSRMGRRIGADG